MKKVDTAVYNTAYVSVHDLADMPYRDMYEAGTTPSEAADRALENEGF